MKTKVFKGYVRKSEVKELKWRPEHGEQTLNHAGSYIGKGKEYDDDIKIRITIEETP